VKGCNDARHLLSHPSHCKPDAAMNLIYIYEKAGLHKKVKEVPVILAQTDPLLHKDLVEKTAKKFHLRMSELKCLECERVHKVVKCHVRSCKRDLCMVPGCLMAVGKLKGKRRMGKDPADFAPKLPGAEKESLSKLKKTYGENKGERDELPDVERPKPAPNPIMAAIMVCGGPVASLCKKVFCAYDPAGNSQAAVGCIWVLVSFSLITYFLATSDIDVE
jgi:hypothetical protein